eukprot:CAMPEP_0170371530 /NCGR_PEP_ID=MMETSP0117_2-20130122/9079_1 /TAXON_ID=400756 /ORGANISM="Durinskia baltica, Strain CSIRO CS-38" /LENGTH=209 /DNA_ID=CAMNT_0010626349 /DNA_START=76 /DNA_END=703 /DNA_ORIENTATION=+
MAAALRLIFAWLALAAVGRAMAEAPTGEEDGEELCALQTAARASAVQAHQKEFPEEKDEKEDKDKKDEDKRNEGSHPCESEFLKPIKELAPKCAEACSTPAACTAVEEILGPIIERLELGLEDAKDALCKRKDDVTCLFDSADCEEFRTLFKNQFPTTKTELEAAAEGPAARCPQAAFPKAAAGENARSISTTVAVGDLHPSKAFIALL